MFESLRQYDVFETIAVFVVGLVLASFAIERPPEAYIMALLGGLAVYLAIVLRYEEVCHGQ